MNMLYGEVESRSRPRHLITAAIGMSRAKSSQATMAAEVTAKSQTSSIKIRQIVSQAVVLQNSTSLEMDLHDQELVSYQRALNFLKVKEPEIGLMYSSRRNPLNSLTSRHMYYMATRSI
jgi:hypothetical protein